MSSVTYTNRLRRRITPAAVFTIGALVYGYGVLAGIGLVPGRGFVIGAFTYAGMAVGAAVASTTGMAVLLRRATRGSLSLPVAGGIAGSAAVLAALAVGPFLVTVERAAWTAAGQFVVALHLTLGVATPAERASAAVVGAALAVGAAVLGLQLLVIGSVNVASVLFVAGLAAVASLLFGAPLFLVGQRL